MIGRHQTLVAVTLVALLCSIPSAAARRPGLPNGRRIRPIAREISPLPLNLLIVPPPERSAVEAEPFAPVLEEPISEDLHATQTCGAYTETDIRPLRTQWDSGNGYCGEMSLQLAAMTRGVYISQKLSRSLGVPPGADHPDLLFEERSGKYGIHGVAKMMGLYQPPESIWWTDNQTLSASKQLTPAASSFASWIKRNVIAGRPVIGGFRVRYGGYPDYDHIMPVYGACYNNANSLSNSDNFILTDNYGSQLKHTPADATFYAPYGGCRYTGCIPNDYWDLGVAIGPLNAPANLYFPVKIVITGWSDGSSVNGEPGEYRSTTATAGYSLAVRGLTAGQSYRVYRMDGFFGNNKVPQSVAELSVSCTSRASSCRSIVFTATAATASFTHTSTGSGTVALGRFPASGVTYFFVVRST